MHLVLWFYLLHLITSVRSPSNFGLMRSVWWELPGLVSHVDSYPRLLVPAFENQVDGAVNVWQCKAGCLVGVCVCYGRHVASGLTLVSLQREIRTALFAATEI